MARPIRSHVFRGRRYTITSRLGKDAVGGCDGPPSVSGKELSLKRGLKGIELLTTAIHEGLHATNWDLDETTVDETSTDIAKFLWRLGFRQIDS